ncbi:hypothetical protein TA3x_003278 [Tundrisphaera sp. TA3]|uniref:hypothetical protein n=1 Tax=Tundrisphaera sp. TA3 TaxID=3435775 RepID=UPI003EBC5180
MSAADGLILPKPQIPKTLGILNIIFGVLLILVGSCLLGFTLIAPMTQQFAEQFHDQAKQQAEAKRQAQLKTLDEQIQAAATEEEKTILRDSQEDLRATPLAVPLKADLSQMEQFKHPTIRTYTFIQGGSGLLWDIALIISGIGLIRLKEWGRSLAFWLSGIQIVRIALLVAASFLFVAPVQKMFVDRQIAALEERIEAKTALPQDPANLQMLKISATTTPITLAAYGLFGVIYPIVSLILLNSAGARAACQPVKPDPFSELPGAP